MHVSIPGGDSRGYYENNSGWVLEAFLVDTDCQCSSTKGAILVNRTFIITNCSAMVGILQTSNHLPQNISITPLLK